MIPNDYENDELIFLSEENGSETKEASDFWNVLVVDDDEEIHAVTRLALSDLIVNDKGLKFVHAYSGKEALKIITEMGSSIAIILLDVVMEEDDSGLKVAQTMRSELGLSEPRIILRTGQPGYAPEEQVIKDYDINDYKTKTELTRNKLVTTIIASLRSYQQILSINQSRLGLQKIIASAAHLMEERSVVNFCGGVVTQICSLIGEPAQGIVCSRAGAILDKDDEDIYVLGGAGELSRYIDSRLQNVHDKTVIRSVNRCLSLKQHLFEEEFSALYLKSSGYEAAVYLQIGKNSSVENRDLLEVFLSSVSVGYENVNLFYQLRNAAFRDWLTKLPNRSEFINMLDELGSRKAFHHDNIVALIDISHFADINDGLGPDVGNSVLLSVVSRLESSFRDKVGLGRIGSDVFGLIGPEFFVNPKTLQELFVTPFKAAEHTLHLSASFGLVRIKNRVQSGINILKQSNIALNEAKKNLNNNFAYYEPEMEEQTTWRLDMIRQLGIDFKARRLQVWYQPQVDLVTEEVVGMEALLRWPASTGGFISPDVFIPLAEYSGLIIDIGAWVLEESCRQLAVLSKQGFSNLRMAINISMPQFRDPTFISLVKNVITAQGVKPEKVELEITESIVMDEPQIVVEALHELKKFGVMVAIDDFGTGFSSMSYLQQLPLDRIKVDRSFVNEISPNKSAFIAETIVTLGNRLGLATIAEGVEKREQASYMLKLGCDEAQGYLYAKPMPFDELLTFLNKQRNA